MVHPAIGFRRLGTGHEKIVQVRNTGRHTVVVKTKFSSISSFRSSLVHFFVQPDETVDIRITQVKESRSRRDKLEFVYGWAPSGIVDAWVATRTVDPMAKLTIRIEALRK